MKDTWRDRLVSESSRVRSTAMRDLGGLGVSLSFTEEPNQKNTKGASWLEEVPGRKNHQRNGMNLLSEAKDIG